jgi:putative acetyltransferase
MNGVAVRPARLKDLPDLKPIHVAAFPDEELWPLVERLIETQPDLLSLVAEAESGLIGHVLFTPCSVDGSPGRVALLGPLAVLPDRQRQGLGTALVRDGLERLRLGGYGQVQVLGDPNYYGRAGFVADRLIRTPYPLRHEWEDAWQTLQLDPARPRLEGDLVVPMPWRDPALWC